MTINRSGLNASLIWKTIATLPAPQQGSDMQMFRRWVALVAATAIWLAPTSAAAKEPVELRRLTTIESPGAGQQRGAIVYLHGSRAPGDAVDVLPIGYSAFAQRMRLDQFAVVRPQEYDTFNDDGRIIAFTVTRLRQLSEEGYRTIYLAGHSRGAWLAAVAGTISGDITGSGLTNLRRRAEDVGGAFTVENVASGGTLLRPSGCAR